MPNAIFNDDKNFIPTYIGVKDVCKMLGLKSYSAFYSCISKKPGFPQAKRFSPRLVLYNREDVLTFMKNYQS